MEHETTIKYLSSPVANVSKLHFYLQNRNRSTAQLRSSTARNTFQIFKPRRPFEIIASTHIGQEIFKTRGREGSEWNEFKVVTDRFSRSRESSSFQNRQRFNSTSFRSLSSWFSQFSSRVASWINSNYRLLFRALK